MRAAFATVPTPVIGLLDIGGTKLLATTSEDGRHLGEQGRRDTPPTDPLGCLGDMLDTARNGRRLTAIGCAVPGPFDRARGALTNPPNLPPAWQDLALRQGLSARFGCPVLVENDANCAGLAEARWGVAAGLQTVVYYTVSTGIGTGVVRDGQVLIARHDSEGGHQVLWPEWLGAPRCLCGGAGCLEALVSGGGLQRRFGRRAEDIDDPAIWEEVGRWLGIAVANTTALLDPDAVVFGGGICAAWDRFLPALRRTAKRLVRLQPLPPLLLGSLGNDRNLLGALALVQASD